jgi:asparagine synthase (glutamine-hydrolysing)
LKKVARTLLPSSIVDRKKKGFGIPLAKWLHNIPATPLMAPLSGVRLNYARRAFTDHRAGDADHRLFLWSWIVMQTYAGKHGSTGGQSQQAPASI